MGAAEPGKSETGTLYFPAALVHALVNLRFSCCCCRVMRYLVTVTVLYLLACRVTAVSRAEMPLLSSDPSTNHFGYIEGFDVLNAGQQNALDDMVRLLSHFLASPSVSPDARSLSPT